MPQGWVYHSGMRNDYQWAACVPIKKKQELSNWVFEGPKKIYHRIICGKQQISLPPHVKEDEATINVVGQTHRSTWQQEYGPGALIIAEKWVFVNVTTPGKKQVLSTVNNDFYASQPITVKEGDNFIIETCAYLKSWVTDSSLIVMLALAAGIEYDLKLWGEFLPITILDTIYGSNLDQVASTTGNATVTATAVTEHEE